MLMEIGGWAGWVGGGAVAAGAVAGTEGVGALGLGGLGAGEGVTVGVRTDGTALVGTLNGRRAPRALPPKLVGTGNSAVSSGAARAMNLRQISAGSEPPLTLA